MYPPAPDFPPQIARKESNPLGIVALTISIIGFICACIPGILIVGWILLPIGFILGIVAAVLKNKVIWPGVSAIIVSVTGTIIGVLVFLFVLGSAFDQSLNTEVTDTPPTATTTTEQAAEPPITSAPTVTPEDANAHTPSNEPREGTRENPFPIGTPLSNYEWIFTVNHVDLDATEAVTSFNRFNQVPVDGYTYILLDVTVTYIGNDPNGAIPFMRVEYVSPQGHSYDSLGTYADIPYSLDSTSSLYSGASVRGNIDLVVPTEGLEDGVLAIQPDFLTDKAFIAVK
ncbi:MAG: hypothetical protein Q4C87_12170 [Actinomycetaceae bacterium]|nr:hypothetical protein [Actinomycetaceae bacterium]